MGLLRILGGGAVLFFFTLPGSDVYIVALGISAGEQLDFELDWLLKLRLVVARHGEQDVARWWNTTGQLSARGASVLGRGFPRTHHFAQARSVFAAAETRCAEVFGLAGAVTLWRLDDEVEEAFDQQWERWLDHADEWSPFFEGIAGGSAADLQTSLLDYALVDHSQINLLDELSIDSSGQSLRVGDNLPLRDTVALLASGFSRGAAGTLVVPYAMAGR